MTLRKGGGEQADYLKIELKDVLVSTISSRGTSTRITLSYGRSTEVR